MNELMLNGSKLFSSLYLVEQINVFRAEENNKANLWHKSLLTKIEIEFKEEIEEQNILPSSYLAGNGKNEKCYELTFEQSLQILMSESKIVRKGVIAKLKEQSEEIKRLSVPQTFREALLLAAKLEDEREQLQLQLSEQAPKIAAFERVIDGATTYTLDSVSDILNIGRTSLSKMLKSINWAMVDSSKGTSSTRYAELRGYAKTVFEYITIGGQEYKQKKIVLTKKGLDSLIVKLSE